MADNGWQVAMFRDGASLGGDLLVRPDWRTATSPNEHKVFSPTATSGASKTKARPISHRPITSQQQFGANRFARLSMLAYFPRCCTQARDIAMTYRVSYLAAALTVAALTLNIPVANAQPTPQEHARIASGIEEAIKILGTEPRLKKLSPQARRQLMEFILGNTIFAMGHEMGHGLINEMSLPVLGREEDAADSFATVNALKVSSSFSERVLIEAGRGLLLSAKRDKKEGNALVFYDEHGLDPQRAYSMICLMVGSSPDKYRQLAKDTKLPEDRQKSCVYDWRNTAWSWNEMLNKHLRGDKPKTAVKVAYEDTKKYAAQAHVLRAMGLLEMLSAHAADRWAWPNPITIEARSCGMANARWSQRTLTLCYELVDEFIELYLRYSKTRARKYGAAR
jgi:hypothetical protein